MLEARSEPSLASVKNLIWSRAGGNVSKGMSDLGGKSVFGAQSQISFSNAEL